jgi:hypothetical protein
VPLVVELAAVAYQAVAAVVDPAGERFPCGHDAVVTSPVHGGGDLERGQRYDAHLVAVWRFLVPDDEARVQHEFAFGDGATVVLVDTDRDAGGCTGPLEVRNDLGQEPAEGRPNIGVG